MDVILVKKDLINQQAKLQSDEIKQLEIQFKDVKIIDSNNERFYYTRFNSTENYFRFQCN